MAAYSEGMPAISLKAHFNGKQIVLDEPFDLPPDVPLIVTVMEKNGVASDASWQEISMEGLASAYGENEPDYSANDLKR